MKGSTVNTKTIHVPKSAVIATILMVNIVMATRISVSRSLHPILRHSPKQNHIFTPRFASKHLRKSHLCPLWSSSFSFCLNSLHKSKTTSSHSFSSTSCPASLSMAAATAAVDAVSLQDNPLLQDFEFPPFDVVDAKHVRPGIRALLKKLEIDLEELEKTVEPSWSKLVEPLEKITDRLTVVWGMINHLKSVKDTSELRSAIEEVQPEKVKFQLRLGQSKPIYNAFKAIRESPEWNSMSEAHKRVVECG